MGGREAPGRRRWLSTTDPFGVLGLALRLVGASPHTPAPAGGAASPSGGPVTDMNENFFLAGLILVCGLAAK